MSKDKELNEYSSADFINKHIYYGIPSNDFARYYGVGKKGRILRELTDSRYDNVRTIAYNLMRKNNEGINMYCDEVLRRIVPPEATPRQREVLTRIIARAIYTSVYSRKLNLMRETTFGNGYNYTAGFNYLPLDNARDLKTIEDASVETYPVSSFSVGRYGNKYLRDQYGKTREAIAKKGAKKLDKISFFSRFGRKVNENFHMDTILRLKQYLFNGGSIDELELPASTEREYNDIVSYPINTWFNLFMVINSDIDQRLGMSKQEIFDILNNPSIERSAARVCEYEKLGIKFSDRALRKEMEKQGYNPYIMSKQQAKPSTFVHNIEKQRKEKYIVETAVKDTLSKIPRHASTDEALLYIMEDTIDEWRHIGVDESTIQAYRVAVLEYREKNARKELIDKYAKDNSVDVKSQSKNEYVVDKALVTSIVNDVQKSIPKHGSKEEWFTYIIEDKGEELREAGVNEATIESVKKSLQDLKERSLTDKKNDETNEIKTGGTWKQQTNVVIVKPPEKVESGNERVISESTYQTGYTRTREFLDKSAYYEKKKELFKSMLQDTLKRTKNYVFSKQMLESIGIISGVIAFNILPKPLWNYLVFNSQSKSVNGAEYRNTEPSDVSYDDNIVLEGEYGNVEVSIPEGVIKVVADTVRDELDEVEQENEKAGEHKKEKKPEALPPEAILPEENKVKIDGEAKRHRRRKKENENSQGVEKI